jgi:transcriptional regulator with XRE-family HTH domain
MTETHVHLPTLIQIEAAFIGNRLRRRRRKLGLRRRHLATEHVPPGHLRAIERGAVQLDGATLTEVASAYGVDLAMLVHGRPAMIVDEAALTIGEQREPFTAGSLTSMVCAYLALMKTGDTSTTPGTPLHRDDIVQLADRLDLPCVSVISRIADQMRATGAQTRAMVSLYLEGASVIGVS